MVDGKERKRGRGRPSLGDGSSPTVQARVPQVLIDQLDAIAAGAGITRSVLVRDLLEAGVKDRSAAPPREERG